MKYNSEERVGVHSVAKIFEENFSWIFREQPVNDFGIDGFVEIAHTVNLNANERFPTGKLIGVQIKSGETYFREYTAEHFVFRGKKSISNIGLVILYP